jgi:hypothetical protein
MKSSKLPVLTVILLLFLVYACKKTDFSSANPILSSEGKKTETGFAENDAVLYWNDKANTVISYPMPPQVQSRFFAMVQIAVHDALNSIKPKYQRYALLDAREQFADPDAAVASAAYNAIMLLHLERTFPVTDWYNQFLTGIPDGEGKTKGISLGLAAAEAIIANRANDNYASASITRAVSDGVAPGEYRSTLPYSNPGMPKIKALDQWGNLLQPFVIESATQFRVAPPYAVTSHEYTTDFNEVKIKGGRAVHNRTADEDEIGKFWVEKSSFGWNRLARQLIATRKMDAWKTARVLALMHTAMTDGSIANFESKYHYFYWRPETAIRLAGVDGNPETTGDAGWLPSYTETPAANIYTPPVPEYPSAHANFGGAAGEILKLFFETENISLDLTSPTSPGVTRHYNSIAAAIRDNSLSRIYVGFHFRKAVMEGEQQGINVADYVFAHAFRENGEE